MIDTKAMLLSVVIEPNDDGFLASVPDIQGAFGEGETVEEAIFNCVDVVKVIAAYRAARKESLPFGTVAFTPNTRFTVALPVGVA
jgi:predicted RNase H-like HicB family nuclease